MLYVVKSISLFPVLISGKDIFSNDYQLGLFPPYLAVDRKAKLKWLRNKENLWFA